MNSLDKQYTNLLQDILDNGVKKETRNGGTISVFGRQIRHSTKDGFPLLTTKKMAWKQIVTELIWFLRGETNIKFLVDNDCHIWDGDCYQAYLKQFEVDANNFNGEEVAKGHNDQCWGYPLLENTSKEYKRGQINAYLEGKAEKPFFYLTQEEFINKIKTDDVFANKWGLLGKIYGHQWRSWVNYKWDKLDMEYRMEYIDQIANSIKLLKTDPDSRRNKVSAWNVSDIENGSMILPPCHTDFQFYTRELSLEERVRYYETSLGRLDFVPPTINILDKENIPTRAISLMFNMRSTDVPLGLPFNLASYGLLLEIIAKIVNMVPDELICNLGDAHIYLNQIEGVKEQLSREPFELPKLVHYKTDDFYKSVSEDLSLFTHLTNTDFALEGYQSHSAIKIPLSN